MNIWMVDPVDECWNETKVEERREIFLYILYVMFSFSFFLINQCKKKSFGCCSFIYSYSSMVWSSETQTHTHTRTYYLETFFFVLFCICSGDHALYWQRFQIYFNRMQFNQRQKSERATYSLYLACVLVYIREIYNFWVRFFFYFFFSFHIRFSVCSGHINTQNIINIQIQSKNVLHITWNTSWAMHTLLNDHPKKSIAEK